MVTKALRRGKANSVQQMTIRPELRTRLTGDVLHVLTAAMTGRLFHNPVMKELSTIRPYFVVVARATCVHDESTLYGQYVFKGHMNLIGPPAISNGGMHHHSIADLNAQPANVFRQSLS